MPQDTEAPLAPGYLAIDLPPLTMEQRTTVWQVLLDEHRLFVRDPGELADRFRVGPGVIANVCEKLAARAPAAMDNGERPDSSLALEVEIRQFLEVNYLLQRLDTFESIAILTTNFGTAIDNAFKRRLSFRLTFPFPDEEAREALWRAHLPKQLPTSGNFDLTSSHPRGLRRPALLQRLMKVR